MSRSPSSAGVFVVPALLSLALAACGVTQGPAATVGDVEITHEQLETDIAIFRFVTGLSGSPCGAAVSGESAEAACARFTLSNVIQEEIVKAYATVHDVAVDPAGVTDTIGRIEESLGGTDALNTRLRDEGVTRAQLEDIARRLLLFGQVQQAVVAERLDDATLEELYEQTSQQFVTVEVSHILLETREEAEEVAERATLDNFARLARERSIDPGSAENGGSLGMFSEDQFRQQFDATFVEAALALEPGTISEPVETQFGFHVIALTRRDVAQFEDVREQLLQQQAPTVFQEWLVEQYDTVTIDVNPRYGRLDPDTGDVVAVRSTAESPAPTGATAPATTGP